MLMSDEVGHALSELAQTGLNELLALLGHVVFGVFAEIAKGSGLLDLFGEIVNQLMFEWFISSCNFLLICSVML